MDRTLVAKIVGSAFVVFIFAAAVAGLQFYGVIAMTLGLICFGVVWVIGLAGLLFSEWFEQKEVRTKVFVGIFAASMWSVAVYSLNAWGWRHSPLNAPARVQEAKADSPTANEHNLNSQPKKRKPNPPQRVWKCQTLRRH